MSEQPVFNYDHYKPGKSYGTKAFDTTPALVEKWRTVYAADSGSEVIPAGMLAMIVVDAVLTCNAPRPPGGVHAGQSFEVHRLPLIGERLNTEVVCIDKEIKNNRKWVKVRTTTSSVDQGDVVLVGVMTTLLAD